MIDKDLFRLLGKNKKYIFIVVFLSILSLLATTLFSYELASIITKTVLNKNSISIGLYKNNIIYLILSILFRIVSDILTSRIKDKLSYNVKYQIRKELFTKVLSTNNYFSVGLSGLTQLSMEGIEQLDMYYSEYLPQFFYALIAPIILFFINIPFNFRPALVLIIFVPLIPASIIAISKYAKKVFAKYWDKYLVMGKTFLDLSSGLKDLKIFRSDDNKHKEMNVEAEEFRKITMKVLVMQLASTTIMDLVAYGGAGCGIMCAILTRDAYSSLTGLIFLILCAIEFFLPMRRFGSAFHIGMNGATAGKKILKILNLETPEFGEKEIDNTNITIKDLSFGYDENKTVLSDINMAFENSGLYSIVGASGCGKSTLVKLLKGEVRTNNNHIFIGNTDLYELSRVDYYKHLSVISYNSYILSLSIRDNFKIYNESLTDEEMFAYLKKVNLDLFIKHEGGLDLVLTEGSTNISGGERQRLALALALGSKKDIYIFDEATSSIDVDSEKIIMDQIKELSKTKLVILISHRLQNVVESKNIYYLENGKVLESGTHDSLTEKNGGYFKMYNMQISEEAKYKGGISHE